VLQRSLLSILKSAVRGNVPKEPLIASQPTGPLGWFLEAHASQKLDSIVKHGTPELQQHCLNIIEKGFTVVSQAISRGLCDRIWRDFLLHVAGAGDESKFRDEDGLHSRLCNFHGVCMGMREAAFEPRITQILDTLFGVEACIYSSLTFEKSTQQFTHRDCPFFYTQPEDLFFGVWFALEDVMPYAGPLFYYEGGHMIDVDGKEIGRRNAGKHGDPLGECFDEYTKTIHQECEKNLKRRTLELKKGDAVIWHPRLPHGGSQIEKKAATRRSMVLHYIPVHIPLYGIGEFFLPQFNPIKPKTFNYLEHGERHFVQQGHPHFDVNY
jgi:phytanoyl-CoA hydroxylase